MKKTIPFSWIPTICVAALVIVGLSSYRNASAAITGKISGIVTSKVTQTPLANAQITIPGTRVAATTNRRGYYVITNVAPGTYDIRIDREGYSSQTVMGAKVLAGLTTTVNFDLGGRRGCHA